MENDRLDREIGRWEMGDNDRMLSKHLTSVSKCSVRSSRLTAMLQIGQITSVSFDVVVGTEFKNLFALKLKSSAFSSRRRFSAAKPPSGLLVDTGGTKNGLENGNPPRLVGGNENGESIMVELGMVEARDSQAWCSIGSNCGLGRLGNPGIILICFYQTFENLCLWKTLF